MFIASPAIHCRIKFFYSIYLFIYVVSIYLLLSSIAVGADDAALCRSNSVDLLHRLRSLYCRCDSDEQKKNEAERLTLNESGNCGISE